MNKTVSIHKNCLQSCHNVEIGVHSNFTWSCRVAPSSIQKNEVFYNLFHFIRKSKVFLNNSAIQKLLVVIIQLLTSSATRVVILKTYLKHIPFHIYFE